MEKLGIKPLGNRVVVEPLVLESVTASGLIIPDTVKEKQSKGTVVAVAKGSEENPMEVNIGDVVLYGKFAGTEIKHQNKNLVILEQTDILAII
jgi:chaperonin GroES